MEDNANPTPLIVEPQEVKLDDIASWIEEHKEDLVAIRNGVANLLRDNYTDFRAVHLGAAATGLTALLGPGV